MKKIGIIFAMEEEINAFKEHIHINKEKTYLIYISTKDFLTITNVSSQ